MNAQAIVTLISVGVMIVGGLIKGVHYLGVKIGSVDAKLDLIMSNHLPHIYERLGNLERRHTEPNE